MCRDYRACVKCCRVSPIFISQINMLVTPTYIFKNRQYYCVYVYIYRMFTTFNSLNSSISLNSLKIITFRDYDEIILRAIQYFDVTIPNSITYDGNNLVTRWDSKNNSVHAINVNTVGPYYLLTSSVSTINSIPLINFKNGGVLKTDSTNVTTNTNVTMFFVVKLSGSTSSNNWKQLLANGDEQYSTGTIEVKYGLNDSLNVSISGCQDYQSSTLLTVETPYILTVNIDSSSGNTKVFTRINGSQDQTKIVADTVLKLRTDYFTLGNLNSNRPFLGILGEFIYFNSTLSTNDISIIETQLSNKWNISLS